MESTAIRPSRPAPDPWGIRVKVELARRDMRQTDLLALINERRPKEMKRYNKNQLSPLLKFGRGYDANPDVVDTINDILGIAGAANPPAS